MAGFVYFCRCDDYYSVTGREELAPRPWSHWNHCVSQPGLNQAKFDLSASALDSDQYQRDRGSTLESRVD